MRTHPHPLPTDSMATMNCRNPPPAAAPKNAAPQTHHRNHHQKHSAGVPKNGYEYYDTTTTAAAAGVRHQANTRGPPQTSVVYQSPIVPLPPPVPSCVTAQLIPNEIEDDFNEITIQFDDGVQTLYVGPVEIVEKNNGKESDRSTSQAATSNPPSGTNANDGKAPRKATRTNRGGDIPAVASAVRSRERFQEEKAIVTLEPVGSRAKSQSLPIFLQQQQQLHQKHQLQQFQQHQQQQQHQPLQQQQQQQHQQLQQQQHHQQLQHQHHQQLQQQHHQQLQQQHKKQQQQLQLMRKQQQQYQQQMQQQYHQQQQQMEMQLHLQQQQQMEMQLQHQQQQRAQNQQQQQQKLDKQQKALKQQQKKEQQLKLKHQSLLQHVQKLQESQQRHQQRQQQLTELQLTVSVQQQPVQPLQASFHQGKTANKRRPKPVLTHQQAVLLQRQQLQSHYPQQYQQLPPTQQPAVQEHQHPQQPALLFPTPTPPPQQQQTQCIKQAPMLNFARAATTVAVSTASTSANGSFGPNRQPLGVKHNSRVPTENDESHNSPRIHSSAHLTVVPVASLREDTGIVQSQRESVLRSPPQPSAVAAAPASKHQHTVAAAATAAAEVPADASHILTTIKQEPVSEHDEHHTVANKSTGSSSQQRIQEDVPESMPAEKKPMLAAIPEAAAGFVQASDDGGNSCTNTIITQALEDNVTVGAAAKPTVVQDKTSAAGVVEHDEVVQQAVPPRYANTGGPADSDHAAVVAVAGEKANKIHEQPKSTTEPAEVLPDAFSLPASSVVASPQTSPTTKRGRGRPPKVPKATPVPDESSVTASSPPSQLPESAETAAAGYDEYSSAASFSPTKSYISVAALCKPKTDRKRVRYDDQLSIGNVETARERPIEAPKEINGTRDAAVDVNAVEAKGNVVSKELITARPTSSLKKSVPIGVSSGEECESVQDRPTTNGSVVKEKQTGPSVSALGGQKESSPGCDSGIESVSDSVTALLTVEKKQVTRGRPKSSLSVVSEEDREIARQLESDGGKTHFHVPSCKSPTAREADKGKIDEEKEGQEPSESLARTVRSIRKPSAKAKEVAEASGVAQSVALSNGGEIQCCKCDMSFKTGPWYRQHLINAHELDLSEILPLLPEQDEEQLTRGSSPQNLPALTNCGVNENGTSEILTDENAAKADPSTEEKTSERAAKVSKKEFPSPSVSSSLLANGSANSRKRRKSTISSEEGGNSKRGARKETSSPVAHSSRRQSAVQQNGTAKNVVKIEQRAPTGRSRNMNADSSDEGAENSKPLVTARAESSLLKPAKVAPVSPPSSNGVSFETKPPKTKEERYEPYDPYEGDPDKLTPFEEAKVTMLGPDTSTGAIHFKCTICDGQFTDIPAIKDHLSIAHAAIKKRSCEHCGRTFVQTGDLTRHIRIHTGHRPFKCPYADCNYAFISSGDLHKHVRRHNADAPCPKPHVCDECGKDFERSYDLKRHKTMHLKQQPGFEGITCEVCGKVFARKDQYRAHTYRHMGVRPYQCEVCGKAFTDPSNYSKHARLHELDGVEVVCDFCGRPFKNKSAISKHIFHCQQKTITRKAASKAGKEVTGRGSGGSKTRRAGGTTESCRADEASTTLKLKQEPGLKQQNGGRNRKRRRARSMTPSSSSSDEDDDEDDENEEEDEATSDSTT